MKPMKIPNIVRCTVAAIFCSPLLIGCGTTHRTNTYEFSQPTQPTDPRYASQPADAYGKANCYAKYGAAIKACESYLNFERDPAVKDRMMITCLKNKGFARGEASCD